MKYILVHVGSVMKYPPVMGIVNVLKDLGKEVILVSTDIDSSVQEICDQRSVKTFNLGIDYEKKISIKEKLNRTKEIKENLWKIIDENSEPDTVLWVFSDLTLKHLGKKLLEKKYILHMFELSSSTYYYHKVPFIKFHTKEYAQNALAVIQAEYNRAHISKQWWDLKELPFVLPNKPYSNIELVRNNSISDEKARNALEKLQGKKIILYQGIITPERPLEPFIEAVNKLSDEYVLVVMSGWKNVYEQYLSDKFVFLDFVKPPYHLEVTSHAHIGILTYTPVKNEYSALNALYCAPNKIYEYTLFGIPMIGNNIPGLKIPFDSFNMGEIIKEFTADDVIEAIIKIEENYEEYSQNALRFYKNTDMHQLIHEIDTAVEKKVHS